MATQASSLQNPRLKAMVVPREHGAWGMLLVPMATGAVVAASSRIDGLSLGFFIVAALALFWMRTPVEAWMGTTVITAHSAEERSTVVRVSVALGAVAAVAVAALFCMALWRGLLVIGGIAAAAFALQAAVKRLGRAGRMPAQIIGAIGLTSTAAAAYYVSTGRFDRVGIALWLANWLFAGDQIHFVQVRIRGSRLATATAKAQQASGFLLGQFVLLLVVVAFTAIGLFPKLTLLAFSPALARGFLWFTRGPEALDVHKLGFAELAQALVFGASLCACFMI